MLLVYSGSGQRFGAMSTRLGVGVLVFKSPMNMADLTTKGAHIKCIAWHMSLLTAFHRLTAY
jgi:hypothetical protein